ncbi:regulating synaptic membrane exocytosis protein 2 isoform X2 [Clinocottus analis]|uniref:regulating synaptic membrane exocytosis protein 2 isoform X2 n=1 Tax=Clinocottus analis TaxID=304258 RepID=UPI0035C0C698
MPRSPSDRGLDPRARSSHGCRGNEEELRDGRGRWPSQDKRRREEEFLARYRSDPNLERYLVKPSEEAKDVSMGTSELDHLALRHPGDMDGQWWDQPGPPAQPFTWQPSKDGERLIGRILLNKRMKDGTLPADVASLLGLKVVGGKMTSSGRLCAFITKVKKGSLADTVGHLRPGDQVLEWNGRLLQGATFNEVYNIILDSKPDPQVELLVSRPARDNSRVAETSHVQLDTIRASAEQRR